MESAWEIALVPEGLKVSDQAADPAAGQHGLDGLAHFGGLGRYDGLAVRGVAEGPSASCGPSCLGALVVGGLLARALALDLAAGDGALDAGDGPTLVGRQVDSSDAGQGHPVPVGNVEELLELDRATVQAVEVPHHDGVRSAVFQVSEKALVSRPGRPVLALLLLSS
jgi:hypothetical protein